VDATAGTSWAPVRFAVKISALAIAEKETTKTMTAKIDKKLLFISPPNSIVQN
jgi:hypothetical protein